MPATDAANFGDGLVYIHALHKLCDAREVAGAAALKLYRTDGCAIEFHGDGLGANAAGLELISHLFFLKLSLIEIKSYDIYSLPHMKKKCKKNSLKGFNACMDEINRVNNYFSEKERVADYNKRVKRGLLAWEKTVLRDYMEPSGVVLDVGCGCGREAFALYDQGYTVIGIDLSVAQIKQAKQNAAATGRCIDFQVCDGLHYNFPNDTFDNIIIWQQVLGNVPGHENRVNVLKEARRVLRPGGRIVVSVHDCDNCLAMAKKQGIVLEKGEQERDFIFEGCHWHYFTKEELEAHFAEADLCVLRCDDASGFGMSEDWASIIVCVGEKN